MKEHPDGVFLFIPRSDHPYYDDKENERKLCIEIEKLINNFQVDPSLHGEEGRDNLA